MSGRNKDLGVSFENRCKMYSKKRAEISTCFAEFITRFDFLENNLHFSIFLPEAIIYNRNENTSKAIENKIIVKPQEQRM